MRQRHPESDLPYNECIVFGREGRELWRQRKLNHYPTEAEVLKRYHQEEAPVFHRQQDLNRLMEGWRRPETIIVHEPWWTPAARRADIVLPATTTLERNDILASGFASHFVAMKQAIEPVGEACNDHTIFTGLAERLGFEITFPGGLSAEAIDYMLSGQTGVPPGAKITLLADAPDDVPNS